MKRVRVSSKGKTKGQDDKMSLEDYLLLLQSNSHLHLMSPHLNQIISMHGYKKLLRVKGYKELLIDAVSSLSLLEAARSTLKDYISPLVITTVEEVVADLDYLNWQECRVTSIQALSSRQSTHSSSPLTSPRDDVVSYSNSKHQQSAPTVLDSSAYGVVSAPYGASYPSRASEIVKKSMPKRKTNKLVKGGDGDHGGLDSVSYGSC